MPQRNFSANLPLPPIDLLGGASLFIDFDGTLVDLIDRPDEIVIDDPLRDLLGKVGAAMPGRVAIVTGRSLEQIDRFLGETIRGMAVAGSHGIERRLGNGALNLPETVPDMEQPLAALVNFARCHPGTIVEHKRYGAALHYRLAPQIEAEAHGLVRNLADQFGFGFQTGKMMAEFKIADGDKGQAVSAFLAQPSMTGTIPWFIGDDLTDEAGFVAATSFGGGGIFVGPPRETAASYALADVSAVRAWLAETIQTPA
jgi:trehalose 6-phosphate phosphatase